MTWKKSPGHFLEWALAIKGGEEPMSNFPNYSGGLTETILLGNLAVWVAASGEGPKVLWDAKNMRCVNIPGLQSIVKPTFRDGYTLDEPAHAGIAPAATGASYAKTNRRRLLGL